jgi:hypothetical protein
MKLVNPHLLVFLFAVLSIAANAQFGMGKIEDIEQIKKRKLIIMIEEPRERTLKWIAKKAKRGSVDDYKRDLQEYNDNIKAVIGKFWPYNKDGMVFKTLKEIEAMAKSKKNDYTVITCISTKPNWSSAGYKSYDGLFWVKDIKEELEDRDLGLMFSAMIVDPIEDFGKVMPAFYIPLYDVFPTKATLVYGVKSTAAYFDSRVRMKQGGNSRRDEMELAQEQMEKKIKDLPQKTLFLREEYVEGLTEPALKSVYPYPFQFCSRQEMDDAAMNEDARYAYGAILPYVMSTSRNNTVVFIKYIIDAADNMPMSFIRPKMGSMMLAGSVGVNSGSRNFTVKSFEEIMDQYKDATTKK